MAQLAHWLPIYLLLSHPTRDVSSYTSSSSDIKYTYTDAMFYTPVNWSCDESHDQQREYILDLYRQKNSRSQLRYKITEIQYKNIYIYHNIYRSEPKAHLTTIKLYQATWPSYLKNGQDFKRRPSIRMDDPNGFSKESYPVSSEKTNDQK